MSSLEVADEPRVARSVREFGKTLNLGRSTIYKLIASNKVESVTVGRRRLVTTDPAAFILNELKEQKTA